MAEQLANNANSTITAINSSVTAVTVASAASFPATGTFDAMIYLDTAGVFSNQEIVTVTGVAGAVFTITRGQGGTTAVSHATGEKIIAIETVRAVTAFVDEKIATHTTATAPVFGTPSTVGTANAAGAGTQFARDTHIHDGLGLPRALTGAVAATRYVGGTASVAPTTGTFALGDYVITQSGAIYICTTAGSPGTWTAVSGGGGGAPTTAPYVTTAADAGLSAEVVLGTGVIMSGTAAGRPAASIAGRLYFETDTNLLKRDTGAAWTEVGNDHAQSHADADHSGANKVDTSIGGSLIGTRPKINLINGTGVTMTGADNAGSNRVDVTVNSSAGGATFVRKTSTQSVTSSIVLVDCTDLSFTTVASTNYLIRFCLWCDGDTAGDINFDWTHTGTTTALNWGMTGLGIGATSTTNSPKMNNVSGSGTASEYGLAGAATTVYMPGEAFLRVGGSGGTMKLRFAQRVSSATATRVFLDSYLTYIVV